MKSAEQIRREQLAKEAINLILLRTGVRKKDLYEDVLHQFAASNLRVLTQDERRKYAEVIL